MKTLSKDSFLYWANEKGLILDPRYPHSAVLKIGAGSQSRFWCVPPAPQERPYFLALLLDLMGDWSTCYAWRRLGSWPDPKRVDPKRIQDAVEAQILSGLQLPIGTSSVIAFDRTERDALVTLLFTTTAFGWCVAQDLYVVPDHARQILQADHHDVVHVSFSNDGEMEQAVARLKEEGFNLPDDPPDSTFKRPWWMGE